MDLGEMSNNLLVILAIVVLLAFNIFFRRRQRERTPLEVAFSLLSEIHQNQKLVESFQFNLKVRKFKTGSWQRNESKVDFLGQSLQTTLANAFSMAEGFNQDIDAAKKQKSTSYLSGINVDKLKEPLAKSRQELEEWLQANMEKQQQAPRRRGLLG